jgi:choline-sulfatase
MRTIANLRAFSRKLFASARSELIEATLLSGLLIGFSDLARVAANGEGWVGVRISAAVLGLWLWLALLLGLAAWLIGRIAAKAKKLSPNQASWHGLLALLAGGVAFVLAHKLFSGPGIRQTRGGAWGPWVVSPGVVVTTWLCLLAGERPVAGRWARFARLASAGGFALASIGMLVLESRVPGWYLYIHILILTSALVSAALSVWLFRVHARPRFLPLILAFTVLPSLVTFPASLRARTLLVDGGWAGSKLVDYAQIKVDFDHDGHSPWFGGGDCDDSDPRVFVGAPEHPGDGSDSDCDGRDDPTPMLLTFEPFHTNTAECAQRIAEQARRYPTVVVLVDALRWDRIENPRFPVLSALARESIRFSHVYSTSSTTLSSVPAIAVGRVRPRMDQNTVAQAIASSGQRAAFVSTDLIVARFQASGGQLLRGFSQVESVPTDYAGGWVPGSSVATSDEITARAIRLLDSPQPPDLLWLHYFDVHEWNHLAPRAPSHSDDGALYDAAVEVLEAGLRPLFERRDRINLLLLADHGEALGVHRIRSHGGWVFQQLAHIPLLLRVPKIEPASVDVPVSATGICNLIRELRGLHADASADASLLELVGATDVGNGPGFAAFESNQWSLLYGTHRLLYTPRERLSELYDLTTDPLEKTDLSAQQPQLTAQLLARLFELDNETRP